MFRIAAATTLFAIGLLAGCSTTQQTPAVADAIRKSLDQATSKRSP